MAEITASMVKQLRDRTQAAMMLCKEALTETNGDMDEAVVYIRKKLGAKLSDRGDRVAAEGVVAVYTQNSKTTAVVELNSETDFVARNEDFKHLAQELAQQVAHKGGETVDIVLSQDAVNAPGATMQSRLEDVFTKLRERIVFRRFELLETDERGVLGTYVHIPANDKIGVVAELEAADADAASSENAARTAKEIAMHIAASRPKYNTRADVPAAVIESEKDISRETARREGKPEAAIEKIAEGRLRSFYEENVLMDQAYFRDPKKTVEQFLKENGMTVRKYVRYEVGEAAGGAEASGSIKESAE